MVRMRRMKKLHQPRVRTPRPGRAEPYWDSMSVHMSTATVGPDISTPAMDDVMAAVQAAPRGDDWSKVRKLVIPVLPRVRPYPPGFPTPLRTLVPPGIAVGFGVDIGPAFMAVAVEQLAALGITELELVRQATENLSARADKVHPSDVVRQSVDGVPVVALQSGRSIASALILVPDQLRRIFGAEPRTFLAPMRDVLLGFPVEVPPEVAGETYELIASQDPNCLAPTVYRFDGRSVALASLGLEPPLPQRLLA